MTASDPFQAYEGHVTTEGELRSLIGDAPASVLQKELTELDALCQAYIERSPFVLLGSVGADGHVDISPKGDAAGFVRVLSPTLLAIPDRPGNRRLDTMSNLLQQSEIGLIFVIPGHGEMLRIRGEARIVRDPGLCASLAAQGKEPKVVLLVAVRTAFIHCPKCVIRSHVWEPDQWPDVSELPGIRRAMKLHARLEGSLEELDEKARQQGLLDLY